MATIIISLLQKYTRQKRTSNNGESCEEFIQFRLYKILNATDATKAKKTGQRLYASQLERVAVSGSYINLREVTLRVRATPGDYLIIPSCYDADIAGEFLLRLYTETPLHESSCSILHDHKEDLTEEDLFFSNPKSLDDAFSSWTNMLGASNGDVAKAAPVSGSIRSIPVTNGADERNLQRPAVSKLNLYQKVANEDIFAKVDHRTVKKNYSSSIRSLF